MDNDTYDLDEAQSPEEVPRILRNAAQKYYDDASELQSSWQDKAAGKPWEIIAKILERAADQIEKRI